ncbi:1679_t:CDS:1, partial [Acaulospora morrowiae]
AKCVMEKITQCCPRIDQIYLNCIRLSDYYAIVTYACLLPLKRLELSCPRSKITSKLLAPLHGRLPLSLRYLRLDSFNSIESVPLKNFLEHCNVPLETLVIKWFARSAGDEDIFVKFINRIGTLKFLGIYLNINLSIKYKRIEDCGVKVSSHHDFKSISLGLNSDMAWADSDEE